MKKYKILFYIIFLLLVLSACQFATRNNSEIDLLATSVAQTLTAIPPMGTPFLQKPIFTATPTETPSQNSTRYAYTQANNVNLRVNPGRLFEVSRLLMKGTKLDLLGILPNGQWVKVRTEEGVTGWVLTDLLAINFNSTPLLQIVPDAVLLITGSVTDIHGTPLTGVGVSLFQGEQHDDTLTADGGIYYLYVPDTLKDIWYLKPISISCSSNLMNSNCTCAVPNCTEYTPQEYQLLFPISTPYYNFTLK